MEAHFELSDELFEQQFQTCTLNSALFSHEAHLRLAWIHIKKYGVEKAAENISEQLTTFVAYAGARDKYNKTLTIAAIKAINHFIYQSGTNNFYDFIQEFPRLKFNFKELMSYHYQIDIYNSEIAEREFVEPDLLPFT